MGVPVVTLDSRGCRDVVSNGETGVVLSDENPESYMQAISSLIEDKVLLKTYSANALAGRERFGKSRYVEERTKFFTDVVNVD